MSKKTIIFFQPKFWPGPLHNEKPMRDKYYHGVRETFRYFPLALLSVSAMLKDDFDVHIVDERFDKDWERQVRDILREREVLMVGATACTGFEISGALDFSRLVRETSPDVPIVWGGWHASTVPEDTVRSPYVDVVVRGQGEWTARELADRLDSGSRDFTGIDGLTYQTKDGGIVSNPDRKLHKANDLPEIDFSMVDGNRYLKFLDGTPARLFYLSSLGCPFSCSFCTIASVYRQHWSSKDPDRVVREIRYFVDNFGIDTVEFDGTIFFANSKWAKSVLESLIDSGMKLRYVTATRADIILKWNDEMKDVIKRSGFKAIGVGAESGSQHVLDLIDKRITPKEIVDSLYVLKELDIDAAYTFMFGIPGETVSDSLETLDVMAQLKEIMPQCRIAGFFYHPFPGSKTYTEYKELYNLPDLTLEQWANYSFDLKYAESLALTDNYLELINQRVQYLDWGYPEHYVSQGPVRKLLGAVSRLRVRNRFYTLPVEWWLAKALGKSSRLKDSHSL